MAAERKTEITNYDVNTMVLESGRVSDWGKESMNGRIVLNYIIP